MKNPLLIEIPMPIETRRLLIRPLVAGDGTLVNAGIRESIKELEQWLPWAKKVPSIEDSEAHAREAQGQWILRKDLALIFFNKFSGEFLGGSGLHRVDWDIRKFEIGYWLRTSQNGHGFMTEAVTAISLFAFKQLCARRVEIRCDSDNVRSKKIPQRLDFQLDGILRTDDFKVDGKTLRNTHVFSRVDAEGLPDVEALWGKT